MAKQVNKIIVLAVGMVFSLLSYGGNDKIMTYLNGPSIDNVGYLSIADQQHTGLYAPPVTPSVKSAAIFAILKYEESLFPEFDMPGNPIGTEFNLTVTYDITLVTAAYSTVTLTNQVLSIDYNIDGSSPTYKDIDVQRYLGYMEAEISVTAISFTTDLGATVVTSFIPEDVYFELSSEVERYYPLSPIPLITTVSPNTHIINDEDPLKNELLLTWEYPLGAESFDLEWVFVDISGDAATLMNTIQTSTANYDWKEATRINTTNNYYSVSLAYPSGMIVYRVRPVGIDLVNGNYNLTTTGDFTIPFTGTVANALTAGYAFPYIGLDKEKNWTYKVAYAEEGKRKEGIQYFDGSSRVRQSTTILNTDQNAIVAETMYDFEGRPAINTLPTPVPSKGIGFYENGTAPFNGEYYKENYDADVNHATTGGGPDPMPATTPGSVSLTSQYYSQNNTSSSLYRDYTANANEFPFSRTTYKRDGTDRITEQASVGDQLQHGTVNTTKYYYGTPADMEIERLFGNEVGPSSFYQKNMVKDPNGQVNVSYLDKEGRTIATALAGNTPDNLLPLDYKPTDVFITRNLLANNNVNGTTSSSSSVLTISTPATNVTINYTLSSMDYVEACLNNFTSGVNPFECTYTLDIKVLDENGVDLMMVTTPSPLTNPSPVVITNPLTQAAITFDLGPLEVGTYTINKTLKVDAPTTASYLSDFEELIRDNMTNPLQQCVPYIEPAPVTCDNSCEGICAEAFRETYYDEVSEQNVTVYYDEEGNSEDALGDPYTYTDYLGFVEACELECDEAFITPTNLCEQRHELMKSHMSPGGQYFDNIHQKYLLLPDGSLDLDANGNPQPATNPTYDINAWLENKVATTAPNDIFDFKTGSTEYTWDEIRANWNQAPWESIYPNWLDTFVAHYHPEYCAYKYNCLDSLVVYEGACYGGQFSCKIPRAYIADYDKYMMMGADLSHVTKVKDVIPGGNLEYMDFLNPLKITQFTTNNGVTADNSNYMDATDTPSSGNDFLIDPLFNSALCQTLSLSLMFIDDQGTCTDAPTWITNKLKKFIEINDGTNPVYFHSIWYVMDDPADIAGTSPAGLPQYVIDFYKTIHGDGTTNFPGILDKTGADVTKQNKYQFFRGVYKFYRDYILYKQFKDNPDACGSGKAYEYWNPDVLTDFPAQGGVLDYSSYNMTRDHNYSSTSPSIDEHDWFTLVWYRNLAFDTYNSNPNTSQTLPAVTIATASCNTDCENSAQDWLNQLASCIAAASLTPQQIEDLETDLIAVCKFGCTLNPPIGSSDGDGGVSNTGSPNYFESFQQVITYYLPGCNTTVVYPPIFPTTAGSTTECNCTQLTDYAATLSITPPFTQGNYTSIANALTTLTGTTYIAGDVERWDNFCRDTVGDMIDFPPVLECINCKCDALAFFINTRFDDPGASIDYDPYNLDATQAAAVASLINTEFGTSYSGTEIQTLMTQCTADNGAPLNNTENTNFVDLPDLFRCNANLQITDPEEDCAAELNATNLLNYLNLWEQQLADTIAAFETDYLAKCMLALGTEDREVFTATYQLNEYMYTLYYYDQAGNLIKTVPPEGVIPESTDLVSNGAFYDDIDDHRINPYDVVSNPLGTEHQNVEHTLITQYKYDSYNKLIWQSTPDGGVTKFWYDVLGRQLLSQNAKQAAVPSSYVYNYIVYDALGRTTEVGEVESTTEITDDILLYYEEEFLPWLNGKTGLITSTVYPATVKKQVTKTFYDEPLNGAVDALFANGGQKELRTRITSVTREETYDLDGSGDPIDATYDYGTHYSYDIHGNVKELIQENKHLSLIASGSVVKKLTYEYDLVSGNVNKVTYQPGRFDQFIHRYYYDADNRITHAETSKDNHIWDTDAKYFYYEFGPLARTEIGEKQVAGTDYAYTLQGWLKGVNSNTLKANRDIGKDADLTTNGFNSHFATDAFGYSLGYFDGDYNAINNTIAAGNYFLADISGSNLETAAKSLYNGNIRLMTTALLDNLNNLLPVHGVAYRYDPANRIRSSNVFTDATVPTANSFLSATDNGRYQTEHHYDLNGNITELKRNNDIGVGVGTFNMDDIKYKYANNANGYLEAGSTGYLYADGSVSTPPVSPNFSTNKLTQIIDNKGVVNTTDIGITQASNNYTYDPIGQLIGDVSEQIDQITWDTYHKVQKIHYSDFGHPDLEFRYDGTGNRIAKIVKPKLANNTLKPQNEWTTYTYQRDASGNILAVYENNIDFISGNTYKSTTTLSERTIYGSSRLGLDVQPKTQVTYFNADFSSGPIPLPGNVMATIDPSQPVFLNSDETISVSVDPTEPSINATIEAHFADIYLTVPATANPTDYIVNNGAVENLGSGLLRIFAGNYVDITVLSNNMTINTSGYPGSFTSSLSVYLQAPGPIVIAPKFNLKNNYSRSIGTKIYEKSNHLGNVSVTLSDRKFPMKIAELNYHWNFENTDDSEVNGSGLDPVTNTATYVSTVGYDGSDVIETNTGDYVEFADDARLDFGTGDFTVAVWAYRVSQLTWGNFIVNKWNTSNSSGTNEWLLHFAGGISGTTSGPIFGIESGTTTYYAISPTVLNTGQWYFIVGKREGDKLKVYVDGVLKATTVLPSSTVSVNNISGRELLIGKNDNGQYSNMQVDNLMIFDNALSDDQIAEMYSGNVYAYYEPDVKSYSDYYAFGSLLPGRNASSGDYRYGFNGMEKDDEIKSSGNSYDFNARIYDSRLGRFLSLDPLARDYPSQSDYAAFNDNPIIFVDPTGKGGELVITGENTATLVINVVLYSDVVDNTQLQALQASTQSYIKENLSKEFTLKTKEGAHRGQYAKDLNVKFEINIEIKSFNEVTGAEGLAAKNKSAANNYYYVGNTTSADGSGFVGGHQEGNAGYVSSDASGRVIPHEVISSLKIYNSGEQGEFSELHGHNEVTRESILHGSPVDGAKFTGADAAALSKSGVVQPTGARPTQIGDVTNQTYSNSGGDTPKATPSEKK